LLTSTSWNLLPRPFLFTLEKYKGTADSDPAGKRRRRKNNKRDTGGVKENYPRKKKKKTRRPVEHDPHDGIDQNPSPNPRSPAPRCDGSDLSSSNPLTYLFQPDVSSTPARCYRPASSIKLGSSFPIKSPSTSLLPSAQSVPVLFALFAEILPKQSHTRPIQLVGG
jgi:hypothetical protein